MNQSEAHELILKSEHIVMRIAAILFIVGALLFGYGLTLPAYTDEALFMDKLSCIQDSSCESRAGNREEMIDEFYRLKHEMRTSKHRIMDLGGTLISTTLLLFIFSRNAKLQLRSPQSKYVLGVLALALPFLTVGASIFDFILTTERMEFPPWTDDSAAFAYGIPISFGLLLFWSLGHLAYFSGTCQTAVPLVNLLTNNSNWWLLFVSAITMAIVALLAYAGMYWFVIPGLLWVYLYASLGSKHIHNNP